MIRNNIIAFFIIINFLSFTAIAKDSDSLVMVTSTLTDEVSLSQKELRRLYLGLGVVKNDNQMVPIRNHSNDILHEVFLQKVMFMSSRTYERQLNLRTIRKGLKPPTQLSTHKAIINALIIHKNSVAYMWKNQAVEHPNIRILKIH